MTHKHTEPHPTPYCALPTPLTHIFRTFLRISTSLSTVGSSKSCTRKLLFLRGVSHCTQLPEPRTNSISTQFSHLGKEQNRKYHQAELDVSRGDPPRQAWISFEHVWAHVADETQFSSQYSKFVIFFLCL